MSRSYLVLRRGHRRSHSVKKENTGRRPPTGPTTPVSHTRVFENHRVMNPTDRFKPPGWALRTTGRSTMALADMAGRTPCSEKYCAKSAQRNFMTLAPDPGTCPETPSKNWRRKSLGQFFVIRPCPYFSGFDRPAVAPMVRAHHPAAPPRGRAAARHRAAWHPSSSSPGGARPRRRRPGTFSSRAPCMMGMPPGAISHPIGKKISSKIGLYDFFQTLPNASPRVQERRKNRAEKI